MKLAVFISGSGTLLEAFKREFNEFLVVADRECTGLNKAQELDLEIMLALKIDASLASTLVDRGIRLICLAGFNRIIPTDFIDKFVESGGKILNIHPSLLPKYGGKGFYKHNVHQAVIEAGETESGFTIHEVTAEVDAGQIVLQKKCAVMPDDTAETLSERIQEMEKEWYPKVAISISKST